VKNQIFDITTTTTTGILGTLLVISQNDLTHFELYMCLLKCFLSVRMGMLPNWQMLKRSIFLISLKYYSFF